MADVLNLKEIMELIPHRYPFLLVEKIKDFKPKESCVGVKAVSINEYFFQGHFPNNPVMPGVLIVEAMAQTAAILVAKSLNAQPGNTNVLFTGIENVKFRKSVIPGDLLEMHVKIINNKMNIWFCEGIAYVDGKQIVTATFSAMIFDKSKQNI